MSEFLNWLLEELGKISEDEIVDPNQPLKSGDRVVGTLESLQVKKIYTQRGRLMREATELNLNLQEMAPDVNADGGDHDPATCKRCKLRRELDSLSEKAIFLDKLFWISVRSELSEENQIEGERMEADGVGIRSGWQIVFFKLKESSLL